MSLTWQHHPRSRRPDDDVIVTRRRRPLRLSHGVGMDLAEAGCSRHRPRHLAVPGVDRVEADLRLPGTGHGLLRTGQLDDDATVLGVGCDDPERAAFGYTAALVIGSILGIWCQGCGFSVRLSGH